MEHQSLYRRYRPGRFADVRGQRHVVRALQNAVREDRVGHAYLLSGPRGTGKTTLARILAKVLNCENPLDGEPDGVCPSCKAIEAGTSFDLHELDAASNNKVDDMRDLLGKVALGTPGRTKVYLLDEVHMLSAGAENALLKTLEEPPDHVIFVLATTEPHKVVPTVRSRTQHLELTLLGAAEMTEHIRWVAADAGLDVNDEVIDYVVRAGGGSVRDTLSALDQVIAAGGIAVDDTSTNELLEALATSDASRALSAVAEATRLGREPRVIGEALLDALRNVFLVAMGAAAHQLTEREREQAAAFATRLPPPSITRALELVGTALVDMRQAPDPRVDLEVALVRLTRVSTDHSLDALADRLARLERLVADGGGAQPAVPTPPPGPAPRPATATTRPGPAAEARSRLGRPAQPPTAPAESKSAPPEPQAPSPLPPPPTKPTGVAAAAGSAVPTATELNALWDAILDTLPKRVKARFSGGRFIESSDANAVLAFPNDVHRARCEEMRGEVERALADRIGRPVSLRLIADDSSGTPASQSRNAAAASPARAVVDVAGVEEVIDLDELTDAPSGGGVLDRLTAAFPGAELVDEQ